MFDKPKISWLDKTLVLLSGQSWWMVRYENGKVLKEWETVQKPSLSLSNKTSKWEDIEKKGIRGLYLVCPNGTIAALESNGDYLFFQLKSGALTVGQSSICNAHIIGKVDNDNGGCVCYAWNYREQKLERFNDNVTHMAYDNIGPLALDRVGLK